jgi:hypothetical protein
LGEVGNSNFTPVQTPVHFYFKMVLVVVFYSAREEKKVFIVNE